MTDEAIKKRLARARSAAADNLRRSGYGIIETRGGSFDIIAVRYSEARFVRIVLDQPTCADMKAAGSYDVPTNCVREIWEADSSDGSRPEFAIRKV